MSVREVIRFFHQFDPEAYLSILMREQGASPHPSQPNAYMVDELPFYKPQEAEEYVFVVGFNHVPLPSILIEALATHPELVPDEVLVFWTIEQEVLAEKTMGEVRNKIIEVDAAERDKCRDKTQTVFLIL
jgi:hypothetical protein